MDIQRAIHILEDCVDAAKGTEFAQVYQMAISALQEQAEREKRCQWRQEDEDSNNWECSACGLTFFFEDGDPFDNEMRFCPGCAKPIKSIKFREYDTENDKMVDRVVPADGKKPGRLK